MTTVPRAAGAYRWMVLALAWAAFTMTSVDRSTWGPAAAAVSDSLGVPLAAVGVFATGYYLGYVASNLGGGVLVDGLGARVVLGVSGALSGIAMVLFGSTTSIAAGLSLQLVVGLFAGADFAAGLKLIASWFEPARQGFAAGILMTATSLGTVVANAVVPSLIESSGWGASYHVFGVVTVVVAVACLMLVRDGTTDVTTDGTTDGTADGPRPRRRLPDLRPLLRNRDLVLLGLAGFGGLWGTYGFVTWSNTLMTRGSHVDPVRAGIVLVIFAGVAVAVKPVTGWACDRLGWGLRLPIAALLIYFGATLLLFGSMGTFAGFVWVAPLLGIGAYAYSPLTAAITPPLAGFDLTGSAAGAVNAFWQLGSVIVPAVIGPVFAVTHSFVAAFATLAVGPVLGSVVALFVREPDPETARVP